MDLGGLGRALLVAAVVLGVAGVLLILMGRGVLPRLPGTAVFGKGTVRVFVPVGLSILLSVVLTIALNVFFRR
jgi:hypothetical protein